MFLAFSSLFVSLTLLVFLFLKFEIFLFLFLFIYFIFIYYERIMLKMIFVFGIIVNVIDILKTFNLTFVLSITCFDFEINV